MEKDIEEANDEILRLKSMIVDMKTKHDKELSDLNNLRIEDIASRDMKADEKEKECCALRRAIVELAKKL